MSLKDENQDHDPTEGVLVMGKTRSRFEAWCPVCTKMVVLLRPDEAATLTACLRTSQHPLETKKLHIIPTADGLNLNKA